MHFYYTNICKVGVLKPKSYLTSNTTSFGTYPIKIDRELKCICSAVMNSLAAYKNHLAQSQYCFYSFIYTCIWLTTYNINRYIFTYSSRNHASELDHFLINYDDLIKNRKYLMHHLQGTLHFTTTLIRDYSKWCFV